jgi:hypothetical protein
MTRVLHLRVAYDDTLDVYEGEDRVGQLAPSADGWAVYECTRSGHVVHKRVITAKDIQQGVEYLALP